METQQALVADAQTMTCELRALVTSAGSDKEYVGLLRLPDRFDYRFGSDDHFEVQIGDDKWTATILAKPFVFSNTTDVSVALHRPLTNTGWSLTQLESTFDLRERDRQDGDHDVLQYCLFGPPTMVSVRPIMFDKSDRIKIAAIKILNPAHISKRNYEHNSRFRDIILGQDLRTKSTSVLFEGLNLLTTLAEWDIKLNDSQMSAIQYVQNLPNCGLHEKVDDVAGVLEDADLQKSI